MKNRENDPYGIKLFKTGFKELEYTVPETKWLFVRTRRFKHIATNKHTFV